MGLVMRVPFAPRTSAETICMLAISLGGAASAWSIVGVLRLFDGDAWRNLAVGQALLLTAVTAFILSLWIVLAQSLDALVARAVLGAPLGAGLSFATPLHFNGAAIAIATLLGFVFGLASLWPALELMAARREPAHSVRDVQLVNTAAWLAIVAGIGVMLSPFRPWAFVPMAIALVALVVGVVATLRWLLRRRWLARVFEGRDAEWSIASGEHLDADLPIVELLGCWGDERTLVRIAPPVGSAYRSAGRRVAVARVVPAAPG